MVLGACSAVLLIDSALLRRLIARMVRAVRMLVRVGVLRIRVALRAGLMLMVLRVSPMLMVR